MYIVYLLIMLLIISLFILVKDRILILKIFSIILISSGILTTILAITIKILINIKIYYINLNKVTSNILNDFFIISIIFVLLGLFTLMIYRILKSK